MAHSRKLPVLEHYRVLFETGSFSGLTDGELLARFVSKESEAGELAFATIVERHAGAVMRICRATAGNEHDAEDAFQATFLVLATKAGSLRVRESLGPWLSAVAHRVSKGARAVALARSARELRAAALAAGGQTESASRAEIIKVEADLEEERKQLALGNDKERQQRIQEEFRKDPEVIALCEDIALADEQRKRAKAHARQDNDPARVAVEQKYKKLRLQYNKMWEDKYEEISERLAAAVAASRGADSVEGLKRKLESLKAQYQKQGELLEKLLMEKRAARSTKK